MFLFLSKLLPLFLYPLGLACVLMIIALVIAWKRPRWVAVPVALALIVLLVASNTWVTNAIVESLESQYVPTRELPKVDAIVILGGATRSAFPPRPAPELNESGDRVLYGAKLYREGKASVIITSGGRIAWRGGGVPESEDMAVLLEMMGVPTSAIIQDPTSLNTYQNAVNVQQILEQRGIGKILLVTSAMHMPRALRIFQRQGMQAIPAPTDFQVTQQERTEPNNSFEAFILSILPDTERLDQTTRAIKEYIGTFIYRLRGWL